ncbi:MAG: LON peptidase substrate-binding domain-containing protein, partial [Candidatus Dependentiae bacterium]
MKKNAPETTDQSLATMGVVPTIDVVVFPHMVVPLLVLDPKIMAGITKGLEGDKRILLLATKPQPNMYDDEEGDPISVDDLYSLGTICEIIRVMELPE